MQGSTIAAIATPPGAGGIAVVRLSGAESYAVAARVFHPANPAKKVEQAKGCSPLTNLKKKSKHKKASAAPVGAIALTLFSLLHL